jgi:hypothetical protein
MLIAINCPPCGRRSPLLLKRDGRREAVIEDAEKTKGAHRDLDGGTLAYRQSWTTWSMTTDHPWPTSCPESTSRVDFVSDVPTSSEAIDPQVLQLQPVYAFR